MNKVMVGVVSGFNVVGVHVNRELSVRVDGEWGGPLAIPFYLVPKSSVFP